MDWARSIRTYRTINKLTQEEFAALLGVEERSVRRWELGESAPNRETSFRLAELLSPYRTLEETVVDLVRFSAANAVILTPDYTLLGISRTAIEDYKQIGFPAEVGRQSTCMPDEIIDEHLKAINDYTVMRFTSEYIADWGHTTEHVKSDVRILRMFKVPIIVDLYQAVPTARGYSMGHVMHVF